MGDTEGETIRWSRLPREKSLEADGGEFLLVKKLIISRSKCIANNFSPFVENSLGVIRYHPCLVIWGYESMGSAQRTMIVETKRVKF